MAVVAIHHRRGSYSERWLSACRARNVECRVVDAHRSDIIAQLQGADLFLWQYLHTEPADVLVANQVLAAAEQMGILTFPDLHSRWHYDDKIAQKYLLESIGAPLMPAHVFLDEPSALAWIQTAKFPVVFKLRRGAGAKNVRLVETRLAARRLIKTAFRTGFKPVAGVTADIGTKLRSTRSLKSAFEKAARLPTTIRKIARANSVLGREGGYVYFQQFAPDNTFDTRVTIIGERAFAFTRAVRPNDFRASGSGLINFDRSNIDTRCISIAFDTAERMNAQSVAFDFVRAASGDPAIVEVSYSYMSKPIFDCGGYFDSSLAWNAGAIWPEEAILDDLLERFRQSR